LAFEERSYFDRFEKQRITFLMTLFVAVFRTNLERDLRIFTHNPTWCIYRLANMREPELYPENARKQDYFLVPLQSLVMRLPIQLLLLAIHGTNYTHVAVGFP